MREQCEVGGNSPLGRGLSYPCGPGREKVTSTKPLNLEGNELKTGVTKDAVTAHSEGNRSMVGYLTL